MDYTEIRDEVVRGKICELMSEMLDNPDKHGIYPTSKFMWKMETYTLERIKELEAVIDYLILIYCPDRSYDEVAQKALEE